MKRTINLESVMTPEPDQVGAIPAAQPLAPSLRIDTMRQVIEPTATITVRVPVRVRDGLRALRTNTGKSSQDLILIALERLLADNGIG